MQTNSGFWKVPQIAPLRAHLKAPQTATQTAAPQRVTIICHCLLEELEMRKVYQLNEGLNQSLHDSPVKISSVCASYLCTKPSSNF